MASKTPQGNQSKQWRVRFPILWQLLLAFVPLAVVAIAAVGYIGYRVASDSLRTQALRQLATVRDNKQREIERYLNGLEDQVLSLARNPSTALAMRQFAASTKELDTDPVTEAEKLRPLQEAVKQYFATFFGKEIELKLLSLSEVLPSHRSGVYLQGQYIANNPNPPTRKLLLENAKDNTRYSGYHAVWHPVFVNTAVRFRYEDIYLIDGSTGRVVYSVNKGPDYQVDLREGRWAQSGLGQLFQRLQNEAREGDYVVTDFAPYFAQHNRATAFAGTPIFEAGQKTGLLIVQLNIDEINGIMTTDNDWGRAGLGQTGEAYLVGLGDNDLLLRSESRFLSELGSVHKDVAARQTAVLQVKVDTPATRLDPSQAEFSGQYVNYRGVRVLGTSAPLENLHGLNWAVVAEITEDEALQPVIQLRKMTMGLSGALIGVFVLTALLLSTSLSRPVRALANVVAEIQQGNYRARAKVRARNELGLLAAGLNQTLDERVDALVQAEEEHRRLQKEIRDLLMVVAAAADGDFTQRAVVGSGTLGNLADALNLMFENVGALIQHLRGASVRVFDAATEIRGSADQLAEGASRQSEEIGRTTQSVQEMTSRIQAVQSDAEIAAEAARKTELAAQAGGEVVKRVVAGMDALQKNTRAAAVKIKRLGERSMEISTITNTIQKISAQTNMLALNAAIEASRAGEHGLGFSVVADEVRKLAEQTEAATREIAELIASIQAETNDAVGNIERQAQYVEEQTKLVFDAGGSLEQVLEASTQSAELIGEISRATNEQAATARQVSEAMQSISEVARQAQLASERTQQNSASLFEVAKQLNEQIGLFRVPESEAEAPVAAPTDGAGGDGAEEVPADAQAGGQTATQGNGRAVAFS